MPKAGTAREGRQKLNRALPAMQGDALPRASVKLLAMGEIARGTWWCETGVAREGRGLGSLYLVLAVFACVRCETGRYSRRLALEPGWLPACHKGARVQLVRFGAARSMSEFT